MQATPVETLLKPCACAPTIAQLDAAGAALEDLAVLVDEEVVADVVPAVVVAVVAGDPEHDRGRVLGPVLVRVDGVVDERELDLAVGRAAARRDAVAAPLGARDDRRRARAAPRRAARASGDAAARGARGGSRSARSARAGRAGGPSGAAGTRRRRRSRRGRCRRRRAGVGAVVAGVVQRASSASSRRRACARAPAPATRLPRVQPSPIRSKRRGAREDARRLPARCRRGGAGGGGEVERERLRARRGGDARRDAARRAPRRRRPASCLAAGEAVAR